MGERISECPFCTRRFADDNGRWQHVAKKHRGENIAHLRPPRPVREPSIASEVVVATQRRAMGLPNAAWLDDILDSQGDPSNG